MYRRAGLYGAGEDVGDDGEVILPGRLHQGI